ncbi:MAG TPA: amidohydrolase family protein [Thermoplasmata archaeon]|nr:amidohydrolase family protein [Thermoplasmata archaeon]
MLVEGAVLDADGPRPAYVLFRRGRVVEVGRPGTDSTRGRVRKVRGIVIPSPVNSHVHLGDAVSSREPPSGPVGQIVASPTGYKFRLLRDASPEQKQAAMRAALRRMAREGIAATIDFREEGRPGVELLRAAAAGSGVRVVVLGRPLARPIDPQELASLLEVADGVGLSSARDETPSTLRTVSNACRRAGKPFALHASEAVREEPDRYLSARPDLLVHLAKATPDDLAAVRRARVPVAVCTRSNALFGRQPDLQTMERLGLSVLLGTDNAMFQAPSIWRELEFAYMATRLRGRPVSAAFLANAALVEPWNWLGEPDGARIAPGTGARPLIVRLPPDDPAYQIVTRTTEHLIVRAGTERAGTAG